LFLVKSEGTQIGLLVFRRNCNFRMPEKCGLLNYLICRDGKIGHDITELNKTRLFVRMRAIGSDKMESLVLIFHRIYITYSFHLFIFTFLVFYYYITIVKRDMCHIHYDNNWSSNTF